MYGLLFRLESTCARFLFMYNTEQLGARPPSLFFLLLPVGRGTCHRLNGASSLQVRALRGLSSMYARLSALTTVVEVSLSQGDQRELVIT